MSLDIFLESDAVISKPSAIYMRWNGQRVEISREQWDKLHPEPAIISEYEDDYVWSDNITHNLIDMADEAGIYKLVWRPEEIGITKANQMIERLTKGIARLEGNPEYYNYFNPVNGWGDYEVLVSFLRGYLAACIKFPDARIRVSR